MDTNDKIPKFTYDLLKQLDETLPAIPMPLTEKGWGKLDENTLRQMAFYAGQRALVEMLLEWERVSNEGEDYEDADRGPGLLGDEETFGRVLGTNAEHQGVASISVARATIGALLDTGTDE
jgi:hypothetical protein